MVAVAFRTTGAVIVIVVVAVVAFNTWTSTVSRGGGVAVGVGGFSNNV